MRKTESLRRDTKVTGILKTAEKDKPTPESAESGEPSWSQNSSDPKPQTNLEDEDHSAARQHSRWFFKNLTFKILKKKILQDV